MATGISAGATWRIAPWPESRQERSSGVFRARADAVTCLHGRSSAAVQPSEGSAVTAPRTAGSGGAQPLHRECTGCTPPACVARRIVLADVGGALPPSLRTPPRYLERARGEGTAGGLRPAGSRWRGCAARPRATSTAAQEPGAAWGRSVRPTKIEHRS